MSEEVKEEVQENTEAAPSTDEKSAPKKVNRLSLDQLNKKIEDMESKKLQQSKYYKHLKDRKAELEV